MRSAALFSGLLLIVSGGVAGAQTGGATSAGGRKADAPSMASAPVTMAPTAIGSTKMHVVPTPKVGDRTTMTGGNTNGGAN